jgi:H+/gluconate symporter-like permease
VARRLKGYGFAFLVFVALACASYLAGSATAPEPVPDYALQAAEIYRLEIGAAFFVAFYLAVLAVVLALGGKGFTELGTRGLKAQQVVAQQSLPPSQERLNDRMLQKLQSLEQQLETLEAER